MIETALQKIGLTEGEIRVYEALLALGSSSSGKITKHSRISGSKVYEVLDRLMNKGLATYVIKNGVKHFEATNPRKLMDYLLEKEQELEKEKKEIEKIMPQLLARQESSPKSEAKIFTGWEGMKTANEDIIQTLKKGEEWLSMGLSGQPKAWETYFTKRQEVRAKKGIRIRQIVNEKYKELYEQRKHLHHTEFRFLPASFEMPTSIDIYANKIIIFIIAPEAPIAIMIENKAVADSFRKYFETMWEYAGRKTSVYYGKEGALRVLDEILEAGKQGIENVGYGTDKDPYAEKFPDALNNFIKESKKYKFKTRLLFSQGYIPPNGTAIIRHLPKEFLFPVRTMIYGDKVAIVDFTDPITTIIIEKKEIAQGYKSHFDLLWEIAGSKTSVYYGKEGALLVLKQIIEAGKKGLPNYGFGTHTNPYVKYLKKELYEFFEEEEKNNIDTRLLFAEGYKHKQPKAKIRFLPKEIASPVRIMIYDDKVAMVDFTNPITTIIIEKKQIADAYIKHFNFLWKIAKPLKTG